MKAAQRNRKRNVQQHNKIAKRNKRKSRKRRITIEFAENRCQEYNNKNVAKMKEKQIELKSLPKNENNSSIENLFVNIKKKMFVSFSFFAVEIYLDQSVICIVASTSQSIYILPSCMPIFSLFFHSLSFVSRWDRREN